MQSKKLKCNKHNKNSINKIQLYKEIWIFKTENRVLKNQKITYKNLLAQLRRRQNQKIKLNNKIIKSGTTKEY
jgi:hypothetical protein